MWCSAASLAARHPCAFPMSSLRSPLSSPCARSFFLRSLPSSPRRRGSSNLKRGWIPTFVGMTIAAILPVVIRAVQRSAVALHPRDLSVIPVLPHPMRFSFVIPAVSITSSPRTRGSSVLRNMDDSLRSPFGSAYGRATCFCSAFVETTPLCATIFLFWRLLLYTCARFLAPICLGVDVFSELSKALV